jgi:hypothetical protein
VWQDAELNVSDTVFSANQAGGIGQNEAKGSGSADARQLVRAAHILSPGTTVARGCKFTSTAPIDLPYKAPWWIVGTGAGRITLLNSTFEGSTTGRVEGMLSLPNEVSALLRGCTGSNVLIDSKVTEGRLGIVDSIFEPALGASLQYIAPPTCGTEVAGQRMCDPRAACKLRPSGGVECQCIGEDIGPLPGVRDDGSRCATIPSLTCNAGQYRIDGAVPRCEDCPKGTSGAGGKVTTCTSCAPGGSIRLRLCACVLACGCGRGGRYSCTATARCSRLESTRCALARYCMRPGRCHGRHMDGRTSMLCRILPAVARSSQLPELR